MHGKESWTLVRRQKYIYELSGLIQDNRGVVNSTHLMEAMEAV